MKAKILIVVQNPADTIPIRQELEQGFLNSTIYIAHSEHDYKTALTQFIPDIILCNYDLSDYIAFYRLKQQLAVNVPFIFITNIITVERAIELIKSGVYDIIVKENLNTLAQKVNSALKNGKQLPETEQQYEVSEKKDLKKILDFSVDLHCSVDRDGKFIFVNNASEQILGFEATELIGKKLSDFLASDDLFASKNFDLDSNTLLQLPEKKFIHKNGSIVPLFWSAIWDEDSQLYYCNGRDISFKKYINIASQIEQRRFYNLYSQAPSCMGILKGPTHVFELANELYLQLIDKKDIIGKTVKEVLPELESQGIFEILDTVYRTGKTFSANEMMIQLDLHGNGKMVETYLNFIYQAHLDTENNIDGILFFGNDVTEQVLSRKKIEEREKMYIDLIQKLPIATYTCDAEGRIVLYNKAAAALWGRIPQIGIERWDQSWNSSAKDAGESTTTLAEAVLELEQKFDKEIVIKRPAGDERNVLPCTVPFRDAEGNIKGAVIVLTDITEMKIAQKHLRKSEKKYRYLFDNNPMPMWVIDLQTYKFLDVNKMAVLQYGYTREEFLSMSALDIRPTNDKDYFIKASNTSKINRSNYNRGKWNHLKKDGTIVPVEIVAHDIKYEGTPARLILSNDITDQRKAEINLEKRNKDLVKANAELDKFVYSVSHDLRSPLTSILGLLSFIEAESLETDTLNHAEMIRHSVNRLDNFIRNILSYSQNNRTGIIVEEISVNKVITEVINSLQSMREAVGIRYEINIREDQVFYSDKLRLNTILENIISNAIKYHKNEPASRYIKIEGHTDHESFHFTITDNGIGIAPEYHQKIYDMFFRLSSKREGSGIGLYIVKDAIELLQGTIEIESGEGTGTKFSITLKNLKP
jgi:PAS domain S-box-containing protein